MRLVPVLVGLAVALALQTTLAGLAFRGTSAIDLVLIVVIYVGLTFGPVFGLLAGTIGGLAQDALSSGVLGVGGLAKTIVGFVVGVIGAQFIVVSPPPRFLVFFLGAALHAALFMGAYELLDLRHFSSSYAVVAGQAALNALVGVVGFHLLELLPAAWQRRRAGRPIRR